MRIDERMLESSLVKRPANLSVSADLLARARELGINLSATLENALVVEVRRRESEVWLAENRAAIEAYNAVVDAEGVFSDGLRGF